MTIATIMLAQDAITFLEPDSIWMLIQSGGIVGLLSYLLYRRWKGDDMSREQHSTALDAVSRGYETAMMLQDKRIEELEKSVTYLRTEFKELQREYREDVRAYREALTRKDQVILDITTQSAKSSAEVAERLALLTQALGVNSK